ncbi:MAG: hypothetical protein KF725_00085 [Cyclobacteriaceae bacterium]|nr:hypothetical protein [Cyclobacteriaceae bacterium]UYN87133.1 MAG: hypothetical protein KIT51_02320 [Cyclobacteriaceae bacterium]
MKCLNCTFITIAILTVAGLLPAQHNLYGSFGYGLSGGNDLVQVKRSDFDYIVEGTYGSFGKGFRLSTGYGYSITNNIEVVLDYTKVWGSKFTLDRSTQNRTDEQDTYSHYWQLGLFLVFFANKTAPVELAPGKLSFNLTCF